MQRQSPNGQAEYEEMVENRTIKRCLNSLGIRKMQIKARYHFVSIWMAEYKKGEWYKCGYLLDKWEWKQISVQQINPTVFRKNKYVHALFSPYTEDTWWDWVTSQMTTTEQIICSSLPKNLEVSWKCCPLSYGPKGALPAPLGQTVPCLPSSYWSPHSQYFRMWPYLLTSSLKR